ncbi:hypothetical protein QBC35DRAFT_448649 [Podospora australis]|uniref:MARVEL domain-containing protein n=1 Tax=Podospora australis TaxID=1536484 RepID=A0AAN7AM03_9PEZI|nr:hypothetical protein QBC35DRAFT_448649 [Podospora australis]
MEMIPPQEKYVSPRSTWLTKILLRGASILFCILAAAVGGSLASSTRASPYFMAYVAPAIIVCFVWSIAEGFSIWGRGGHRGIHPGAIVAVDLIIWLGLAFIDVVLGVSSMLSGYYYYSDYYSGYYDSRGRWVSGGRSSSSSSERDRLVALGRALFAFFVLLTLTHFALFVIGCVETNIRNRQPKTVYIMQPVYANGQPIQGQFQMSPAVQVPQAPAPVHYPAAAPVKSSESSPERYA